jgi:Flp pilus assembly protein TadG
MNLRKNLTSLFRRFLNDEEASATAEFVILIPVVMWVVFSVIESGWLMTQNTMLSRGLNMAIRDLRLGRRPNPTPDDIKADICSYATILKNCMSTLTLELVRIDNPIANANATCVDRTAAVQPTVAFNIGSHVNQDIMVARVCYVVDPLIPGAGFGAALPKDASGGFHLVSYSAFANEPL